MNVKITIITPVYNEEKTIIDTLDSVSSQTYKNIQHILIDDGSTDASATIIKNYIKESDNKERFVFLQQENSDQLNAILSAKDYVSGDFVYILHGDDQLSSNNVMSKCISYMYENPDIDAIISDLEIMNQEGVKTGVQKVNNYKVSDRVIVDQLLQFGRNQFIDTPFIKTNQFLNTVKNNYLLWNTPFWLDLRERPTQMLVKKINFPITKYRVFEGNYINDDIGKFNVINGELRTAISLMKYYDIPLYRFQNLLSRVLNKFNYKYYQIMWFRSTESKNYQIIVEAIIRQRYADTWLDNKYLSSLINFYKNDLDRTIIIPKISSDFVVYKGKDIRRFANEMFTNTLHPIFDELLYEMNIGFNEIVCNKEDLDLLKSTIKFLNISNKVRFTVK